MATFKENFGNRIQNIRKRKNLTQEKLAEKIGLDTPNLSNIERGKRFVTADTLEKIALALDVSEKELFDFAHLQDKQSLIKEIVNTLENSNEKDVEFFYRIINIYKEQR